MRRALSDSAGFTLLELLIAMALMGLLSLVLFSGLHFGRRVWETAQTAAQDSHAARNFLDFAQSELSRAYPALVTTDPTHVHADLDGDEEQLSFLAPDPQQTGGMAHVTLAANPDGVSAEIESVAELSDDANVTHTTRNLGGTLHFFYYGKKPNDPAPRWYADWHNQSRLPLLVRLTLKPAKHAHPAWTDVIVALRVTAAQDCLFSPLTHNCQGR